MPGLVPPARVPRVCHDYLMNADRDSLRRAAPPSPCTKVCTLDSQGYCAGCLRTGAEIGRWMSMSAAEQWALIAELQRRRAERA